MVFIVLYAIRLIIFRFKFTNNFLDIQKVINRKDILIAEVCPV